MTFYETGCMLFGRSCCAVALLCSGILHYRREESCVCPKKATGWGINPTFSNLSTRSPSGVSSLYPPLAHSVQRLQIELVIGLDRHEAHTLGRVTASAIASASMQSILFVFRYGFHVRSQASAAHRAPAPEELWFPFPTRLITNERCEPSLCALSSRTKARQFNCSAPFSRAWGLRSGV
jgi:hypothetical protein